MKLTSAQKKILRGLAHRLKPTVLIGQSGLADAVVAAIDDALSTHELIKVKFNEFKDKPQKKQILTAIQDRTDCQLVGLIGHTATLYRPAPEPEKRRILLP